MDVDLGEGSQSVTVRWPPAGVREEACCKSETVYNVGPFFGFRDPRFLHTLHTDKNVNSGLCFHSRTKCKTVWHWRPSENIETHTSFKPYGCKLLILAFWNIFTLTTQYVHLYRVNSVNVVEELGTTHICFMHMVLFCKKFWIIDFTPIECLQHTLMINCRRIGIVWFATESFADWYWWRTNLGKYRLFRGYFVINHGSHFYCLRLLRGGLLGCEQFNII